MTAKETLCIVLRFEPRSFDCRLTVVTNWATQATGNPHSTARHRYIAPQHSLTVVIILNYVVEFDLFFSACEKIHLLVTSLEMFSKSNDSNNIWCRSNSIKKERNSYVVFYCYYLANFDPYLYENRMGLILSTFINT